MLAWISAMQIWRTYCCSDVTPSQRKNQFTYELSIISPDKGVVSQSEKSFPSAGQSEKSFPSAGQSEKRFLSAGQSEKSFPSASQSDMSFPSAGQSEKSFPSADQSIACWRSNETINRGASSSENPVSSQLRRSEHRKCKPPEDVYRSSSRNIEWI